MSCIIYQTNKKTGVIYAYRSESYREAETKKVKSKRIYLGRVDPVTNMIIPKAEAGKRNRDSVREVCAMLPDDIRAEMDKMKKLIKDLQQRISELTRKNEENDTLILKLKQLINSYK